MAKYFRWAMLTLWPLMAIAGDSSLLMLDTHLDTPVHFGRAGWDITKRHSFADDLSQVDYPRMVAGGLDGGFFVIYTPQGPLNRQGFAGARDWALAREVHIREMVAAHPDKFALALRAEDARAIKDAGKRFVFQSMENSYPLGDDLGLLETFYRLGVRMAGPVHFGVNQFADSATDTPRWNGLSPLGKKWVTEMNRLGMVIDASHASDAVFDQLLLLSKTPIILSHSGCKAIFDHPRNLDDDRIRRLAEAGGVIQINSVYLQAHAASPQMGLIEDRMEVIDQLSVDEQARLIADHQRAAATDDRPRANFDMFMANLEHALAIAGVDHVGIGADWDGGGGVAGMEDVADLPKVTASLKQAGYNDADIAKIWGGNALRLVQSAEDEARGSFRFQQK
jgi:membrane dipeptidase